VLGGLELSSDAQIVRWPERYADKRGQVMWVTIIRLLAARRSGWDWPDNQDDGQGWCRNAGRA
jgi:hypothetical protein